MVRLEREGAVFVLRMEAGENRFTPQMVQALGQALDEVEKVEGPLALVSTGSGKFYSNGLDLEWMGGRDAAGLDTYLASVLDLFARVLCFPAPTVAAVGGHAFAGGGMLALAHDQRVMRTGRGYLCMPEADLRMPLHPGMTALIRCKLAPQVAHEMIVTGRRYPAEEALAQGIVQHAVPEAELLPRALALAAELAGKAHPVQRALKRGLHRDVLAALAVKLSEAGLGG